MGHHRVRRGAKGSELLNTVEVACLCVKDVRTTAWATYIFNVQLVRELCPYEAVVGRNLYVALSPGTYRVKALQRYSRHVLTLVVQARAVALNHVHVNERRGCGNTYIASPGGGTVMKC